MLFSDRLNIRNWCFPSTKTHTNLERLWMTIHAHISIARPLIRENQHTKLVAGISGSFCNSAVFVITRTAFFGGVTAFCITGVWDGIGAFCTDGDFCGEADLFRDDLRVALQQEMSCPLSGESNLWSQLFTVGTLLDTSCPWAKPTSTMLQNPCSFAKSCTAGIKL